MTKRKSLKDFKSVVKQIGSFTPDPPMKQPETMPPMAEQKRRWKLVRR